MPTLSTMILPALFLWGIARMLGRSLAWAGKLLVHGLSGAVCLWLVNLLSGITGLLLPINALTAWLTGVLGLPGLILVALTSLL